MKKMMKTKMKKKIKMEETKKTRLHLPRTARNQKRNRMWMKKRR